MPFTNNCTNLFFAMNSLMSMLRATDKSMRQGRHYLVGEGGCIYVYGSDG